MEKKSKMLDLLDKASSNKQVLKHLKTAAVHAQSYELAASLGELEKDKFPETKEVKEAKEISNATELLLRMVEIGSTPISAYRIYQAMKVFGNKKGKFDIKDAAKIIADSRRIFDSED